MNSIGKMNLKLNTQPSQLLPSFHCRSDTSSVLKPFSKNAKYIIFFLNFVNMRESDFGWPLGTIRSKGFPGWQSESVDGKLRSSTPASLKRNATRTWIIPFPDSAEEQLHTKSHSFSTRTC